MSKPINYIIGINVNVKWLIAIFTIVALFFFYNQQKYTFAQANGIVQEEAVTASGSSTTSVTTPALSGGTDQLYTVTIANFQNRDVTSVSGLGLTWTERIEQCGGRNTNGVHVWTAYGSTTGGQVTVDFATATQAASIIANRFSGVDPTQPVAAVSSQNTNGSGGGCSGGTDGNSPQVSVTTLDPDSMVIASTSMRNRQIAAADSEYQFVEYNSAGSGGGMTNLTQHSRILATAGSDAVEHLLTGGTDWVMTGLVLKPASGITVTPTPSEEPTTPTPSPSPSASVEPTPEPTFSPPRGQSGDLWADIVIGKRDFGEISPREIVPYKVSSPGGVIVDRSVMPGRLYVWDSGNNRILGIDLENCYNESGPCTAAVVIGQPSGNDYGGCNLDSSFAAYPDRIPASATSLCGVSEKTHTTLEDKSFTSMYVDNEGNLFVADSYNHRVLKFISPFTTDVVADEVWGQPDFQGNGCNITGGIGNGFNGSSNVAPTAESLCFHSIGSSGSGVTFDNDGNMWVVDGGNNRVLRFPKQLDGSIAKTADIVIGQPDFTTGGDFSFGSGLNQLNHANSVRFDTNGKLYVTDNGNNRVLVFEAPFTNGMSATSVFTSDVDGPQSIELDPLNRGMWIMDGQEWDTRIRLFNFDGTVAMEIPRLPNRGGGSIGIDTDGELFASTYVYGQNVHRFSPQPDGSYVVAQELFSPPGSYNLTTERRFEHPGTAGVAVYGDQLFATDGRLLYWNNVNNLTNGQSPDGYLGTNGPTEIPDPGYSQVKVDDSGRVWAMTETKIEVYQAPVTTGNLPIKTITSPISVLGGGEIVFDYANGVNAIAPTADGEYLWVTQNESSRVFRIKGPLTETPVVDIVLGQTDLSGTQCNQGGQMTLSTLCKPGHIALDNHGNLYVSDHFIEAEGNFRMLMFSHDLFHNDPQGAALFAPIATKEFSKQDQNNSQSHATFQPAFDSSNRMYVGYNPYLGPRFPEFYNDPTKVNPADPSDPSYALPDGHLNDYYSWAVAATFDEHDNLYMYDPNRGQIRIYLQPFENVHEPEPPTEPDTSFSPYGVYPNCVAPAVPVETQDWWNELGSPLPGDDASLEGARHIHLGACIPNARALNGGGVTVSGDQNIVVVIQSHNNPGAINYVVAQFESVDGDRVWVREHPSEEFQLQSSQCYGGASSCVHFPEPLVCPDRGDCRWDIKMKLDFNECSHNGLCELRIRPFINGIEPRGDKQFTTNNFQVFVAGPNPKNYRNFPDPIGRGWYTGVDYATVYVRDYMSLFQGRTDITVPEVSGTITLRPSHSAADLNPRSTLRIDPDIHHGNPGTIFYDHNLNFGGTITIDTTTLSNGRHALVFTTQEDNEFGVHSGNLKLLIDVNNP